MLESLKQKSVLSFILLMRFLIVKHSVFIAILYLNTYQIFFIKNL